MEDDMKNASIVVFLTLGIILLSLFLPIGIKRSFAADPGAPMFGYPTDTTKGGDTANAGVASFDWWAHNGCELTLTTEGREATLSTDGTCVGFGTLSLPLPAGADYTTCTFKYTIGGVEFSSTGGIFLASDGRSVYTVLWTPPSIDYTWTLSCSG